jgi:hypothetical protein
VPAQDCGGSDEQPDPAVAGESTDERGDERPVGPGQPRPWSLAVEHCELVAKHEYLEVLGRVGAGEQHHPAHELGGDEVGQSECHMSDHALGRGGANLQVTAVDHVLGTHRRCHRRTVPGCDQAVTAEHRG